jgi:hypothetical protein
MIGLEVIRNGRVWFGVTAGVDSLVHPAAAWGCHVCMSFQTRFGLPFGNKPFELIQKYQTIYFFVSRTSIQWKEIS